MSEQIKKKLSPSDQLELLKFFSDLLPPTWQLIYNEGIRSNHLLFDENDIRSFNESRMMGAKHLKENREEVMALAVNLWETPDLTSMKAQIDRHCLAKKHALYVVYRSMLQSWSHYMKQTLN